MEETKRCPYCGEEILAVAKKCKHCGEWLEEMPERVLFQETITEPKEVPVEKAVGYDEEDTLFYKNIPLSDTVIQVVFWVAVIGLVITAVHGIVSGNGGLFDGTGGGKAGRIKLFLNLCNIIPEWIGNALEGFGVIVMLAAIKQALSKMSKKSKSLNSLFSYLIYVTGAVSICYILEDFVEYEYDTGILSITGLLLLGAQLIIQIILGMKISKVYSGTINHLGKVMYTCGGIYLLLYITWFVFAVSFVDNEDVLYWLLFVSTIADSIVLYFYYSVLKSTLIHPVLSDLQSDSLRTTDL